MTGNQIAEYLRYNHKLANLKTFNVELIRVKLGEKEDARLQTLRIKIQAQ